VADTYDLLTLAEGKSVIRVDTTDISYDDVIVRLITTVSRRLDEAIGPTVQRSVTDERHDGGRPRIELQYGPVSAVTAVTEYQSTVPVLLTEEVPGLEPVDAWYGERYAPNRRLYSGIIARRLGGFPYNFWCGAGNVVCTYTAGRSASTGAVDARIKEGAAVTLKNWWRTYEQSVGGMGEFDVPHVNFPTFAIPAAVREMLHDLTQRELGFGG
jgi:hypothetical protein